jgi:Family of unknown function (DUF6074)
MADRDTPLDWRLVKEAVHSARERQQPQDGRQGRLAAPRPRSPSAPRKMPSAKMIAFPLGRRRDFVLRLAAQVAARPAEAGELHLLLQLDRQRDVLVRKGIPEKAIERSCAHSQTPCGLSSGGCCSGAGHDRRGPSPRARIADVCLGKAGRP